MILLNGHSLTPMARVPLEGMSLKLTERDSTAAITPAVMTGITDGVWLKDDTEPGAGIVWRVRSIQQAYATNTPTVQLEHAVNTLRDAILFGEIKPENISGGSTCTAKQAVEYILARSADWTLGQFDYASVSNPYKFDGDTLYDALEKVTETLSDPWWSYDFSVYPFKLNITQKPAGVACELRSGRNLTAISRTVDRSGMYTRFYPIGKEDLHVPGDYISKNESLYGAVAHVETDQSLETVAELTAWANDKLDRHAQPRVTISADGMELSAATGEPLDKLTLGRLCRIPLNEFSTVIEERIVELNYRDKVHAPEVVTITMANAREDVTRIIADTIKQAARGGGGRAGARQQKEDHAWFEDTDEHVAMCAKGIVGVDASGEPNWLLLSQIIVDGTGIHQHVTEVQEDLVTAEASIEVNAQAITAEVTRAQGAESSLSGQLVVEAGKVAMVVGTRTTQSGEENYIKAGEIVLSINESTGASEAKIDAGHVYIGTDKSTTVIAGKLNASDVTANYIQAKISDISILAANALSVAGGINGSGTLTVANLATFNGSVRLGSGNSFNKCIVSATKDDTTNTLTLVDSNGDVVNFSKAASVTLSGGWSGTTYTASAMAGSAVVDSISTSVALDLTGSANLIGASVKNGTTTLDSKGAQLTENVADKKVYCTLTGGSQSTIAQVSTQDTYDAGVTAGEGKFSLATVTLQGSAISGTAYHTIPTGGTVYYTAGTAVTKYNKGANETYYRGNGTRLSGQVTRYQGNGAKFTKFFTGRVYYYDSGGSLNYLGNGYWYQASYDAGNEEYGRGTADTNCYVASSSGTNYLRGDSVTVNQATGGASITPIGSTSLRLEQLTYAYGVGSTVANTYYTKQT